MVRLRNYGEVVAFPGGRSFYSNPRKRKRKRREKATATAGLRDSLKKLREERKVEYTSALKGAREAVHKQAVQLREVFGAHSTDYYVQEILQRGDRKAHV